MSKGPLFNTDACIEQAKAYDACLDGLTSQECYKYQREDIILGANEQNLWQCQPTSEQDFNDILSSGSMDYDRAALWRLAFKRTFSTRLYNEVSDVDPDIAFFSYQKSLLAANRSVSACERAEISHSLDVVIGALNFAKIAIEDGNRKALAEFGHLQELVYEDGVVDKGEELILSKFSEKLYWEQPPASADGLLLHLRNSELPVEGSGLIEIDGLGEPAYLNRGLADGAPELPPGYWYVSNDDPRVKERDARDTCYLFAVSGFPTWKHPKEQFCEKDMRCNADLGHIIRYVEKNFRTLDLKKEKARVGDLVIYRNYFNLGMNPPHMAVVAEVGKDGRPTRALAKMGYGYKFVEYPIDEASLSYGFIWQVKRHVGK
jgi:hypothetical protein